MLSSLFDEMEKPLYIKKENKMDNQQETPEFCRECGTAHPIYKIRDVEIKRSGSTVIIEKIKGWFCVNPKCEEIEFDQSSDSLQRWASAGDKLVILQRG